MLPKLSIIVPCYNSAKYIEETLSSIAAQNYPNLELIIMDGGSKDETPAIVEKFRPLVSTFISEKDKGQADAILKGFARATGDYVGWCNADDTYLPGALLAAGQALAENPACDIVFGDKDYTDADNQFLFRAQAFTPSIPKLFPFPQIYSEAFLVRREILSEINLNPERHHLMDLDWFVRLFLAGKNFLKAENFRATFRQHADAKSSKQAAVCHRESFDIALSTYSHPRLSPADKSHLIHSMRLMLHNFWGEENYPALREGLARAEKQVGKSIYTPKLTLQLCLSYLGAPAIAAVKKFLRKAITFITYRRERYLMTRLYSNPFEKLPILPLGGMPIAPTIGNHLI